MDLRERFERDFCKLKDVAEVPKYPNGKYLDGPFSFAWEGYQAGHAAAAAEIAELRAKVEAAEKLVMSGWMLVNDFMEILGEPPEANCSCHISPPCHDCVEHSHVREVFSIAHDFNSKARAAIDAARDK